MPPLGMGRACPNGYTGSRTRPCPNVEREGVLPATIAGSGAGPIPAQTRPAERAKQTAKITRLLAILRAHGLIANVPKTHRYQLTEKGRTSISVLTAARHANTKKLLQAA